MESSDERAYILNRFGAEPGVRDELLRYGDGGFREPPCGFPNSYPLPDEPFVDAWRDYARDARISGVLPALRDRLVQLRFPIRDGISATPEYRAATRSGRWPEGDFEGGIQLHRPESLFLELHASAAGTIPVLTASERDDFVTLVQAFTHRNEPTPIPDSMGACIIAGFNNWDRVGRLKKDWLARDPDNPSWRWPEELRRILPFRDLYQDRFILLSSGPYSGVPAEALRLGARDPEFSLTVRREHECAHLFCRRVWGSMRNTVLDELIADFVGILEAAGRFRAEWMLRYLGLEDPDDFRTGGRLQNYVGDPPLSMATFRMLQRLVAAAAHHLEEYSRTVHVRRGNWQWKVQVLTTLPSLSLETMAAFSPDRWTCSGRRQRIRPETQQA